MDTFAIESRRTERERLGLNRRFVDVLAGLSATFGGTGNVAAPLFVLPVDDLDLNPKAALRLMELLRAVSSPHLIVIIAADHELLSTILRLRYRSELSRIAAPTTLDDVERIKADDLAANALRKHLPPAHRAILGLVSPSTALTFTLPGKTDRSLRSLLPPIVLVPDTVTLALDPRFRGNPDPADSISKIMPGDALLPVDDKLVDGALAGYSWPEVLRQPFRSLVDLYLDVLARPTRDDHHEEPSLKSLARERLEKLQSGAFVQSRKTVTAILAARSEDPVDCPTIQSSKFRGWNVELGSGHLDSAEAKAFVGSMDLVRDELDPDFRWPPHMPPLRATSYPHGDLIVWPWVTHNTFWGYERAAKWLDQSDGEWEGKQDWPFGSWIAVMTAQLFEGTRQTDTPSSRSSSDWGSLGERLGTLPPSDPMLESWLMTVGLLCTPEMGMETPANAEFPVLSNLRSSIDLERRKRLPTLPPAAKARYESSISSAGPAGGAKPDKPAISSTTAQK